MATGPQHYVLAEEILEEVAQGMLSGKALASAERRALAHATLALVAVTATGQLVGRTVTEMNAAPVLVDWANATGDPGR